MTSPEHTLVGILGALSLGLHRRLGWPSVAFAGIISNIPDLDGLPMLVDMAKYEAGHRVWGHNFLAIAISSIVVAFLQFRFRLIESLAQRFRNCTPKDVVVPRMDETPPIALRPLLLVAIVFQSIHLVCDMTVSGGAGLSDWQVLPFWPFSKLGFVLPLIPWGDIGPTVIMMAALAMAAIRPKRTSVVATLGLVTVCAYMLARGWQRGIF